MQDNPSDIRPPSPQSAVARAAVPAARDQPCDRRLRRGAAGGLLLLNPGGLRDLILADRAPAVPIFVLLGSFFVTFGSVAMGTAIMALGKSERKDDRPRGGLQEPAMQALASRER